MFSKSGKNLFLGALRQYIKPGYDESKEEEGIGKTERSERLLLT